MSKYDQYSSKRTLVRKLTKNSTSLGSTAPLRSQNFPLALGTVLNLMSSESSLVALSVSINHSERPNWHFVALLSEWLWLFGRFHIISTWPALIKRYQKCQFGSFWCIDTCRFPNGRRRNPSHPHFPALAPQHHNTTNSNPVQTLSKVHKVTSHTQNSLMRTQNWINIHTQ